jgi:hypothetical protein
MSSRPALVALLLLALAGCRGTVEAPTNGFWKVVLLHPGEETVLFVVETTQKSSGVEGRLVEAGQKPFAKAKIEARRDGDGGLRLSVTGEDIVDMTFVAYPPEGESHPKALLGWAKRPGELQFVRFERTDATKLDPKKLTTRDPAAGDLFRAVRMEDLEQREAALRKLADEHPADVLGFHAGLGLMGLLAKQGAAPEVVRERAERGIAFAAGHGPVPKAQTLNDVARILVTTGYDPALALEYARKADEAIGTSSPEAEQVVVVRTLLAALKHAKREDEAAKTAERLQALEQALDAAFLKKAIPFDVEPLTRKGDGDRMALVELFTGAHCPPCIAADIAFDALLKARRGGDVALLQYHIHTPGPDPMGNADVDQRKEYYHPAGAPMYYVNGRAGPDGGGPPELAREIYGELLKSLGPSLAARAGASLALRVTRDGNVVTVAADVAGLKKPGNDARLRLALVQEMARFTGNNGQRLHHHVVRAFLGGPGGVPLTAASAAPSATLDLAELDRKQQEYLDGRHFPVEGRAVNLGLFKVVGFIQDDATREVIQAAEAEVPPGR